MTVNPMNARTTPPYLSRRLIRLLAVLGPVICLAICAGIWLDLYQQQLMWPFPDLYLIELVAASTLSGWGIWKNGTNDSPFHTCMAWLGNGTIVGFMIMGIFSVGCYFAPVAILLISGAVLSDRKLGHNPFLNLGVGIGAALLQAGIMLALARLFYI
jgi:hypothetical protein